MLPFNADFKVGLKQVAGKKGLFSHPHATKHVVREEMSLQERGEVVLTEGYKITWIHHV